MKGFLILLIIFYLSFFNIALAANLDIVINEIAWMGTKANSSDEWIELYNNTSQAISLEGWGLFETGGTTLIEPLTGIIEAKSYYLIERTDDTTVNDIPTSQTPSGWGGSGLKNSGEHLQLLDQNSTIIDEVNCSNGWFAGEASPNYKTMERKNPQGPGSDPNNWATNNGKVLNGHDAGGNPINGTPKARNSVSVTTEPPTQSEPQPEPQTEPETQPKSQPTIYPSGVIFNEILPSPEGPDETEEWIEIFNQNSFEVDLSGWQIADTVGRTITYAFPVGTKISGQGLLVLWRPETKIALNNDEEGLLLLQPNGNILDSVNYQKAPRGQSYHRTESGWAWSSSLTPGSMNIIVIPASKIKEEEKKEVEQSGLAAVSESFRQIQERQIPKSLFTLVMALGLAIFSGAIILTLKRKIKT